MNYRVAIVMASLLGLAGSVFAQSCPPSSSAAVPQSPVNVNLSANSTPQFSWTASTASGVTGYDVILAYGTSNGTVACSAPSNGTQCNAPGQLPSGMYSWLVRANLPNCSTGVLSDIKQFTVGCPANAPLLQSPAYNSQSVTTNVTLSWNGVSGADQYDVYLGTTGTVCGVNASASPIGTVAGTSFTPPQLQAGTSYEWRVSAKKSGSNCTPMVSGCFAFHTACNPPGSFNLNAPVNNSTVTTTTPTLSWFASSGADKYVLHISTQNPPTPSTSDPIVNGSTTSYTFAQPLPPATYFWSVDAYPPNCTTAKTSSSVFSFTIANTCSTDTPAISSPGSGAQLDSTQAVTFGWNSVQSATSYDVMLSKDAGATFTTIHASSNTLTISQLAAGNYTWFVRANFPSNCPSTNSGRSSFSVVTPSVTCPTSAAVLTAPAYNATNVASPVEFDWNDVPGATSYRLVASLNGGASATIAVTKDSEYTTNVPGGTVEWWVEAVSDNCPTIASNHFKFTATGVLSTCPSSPGTPQLIAPANGATNQTSPITFQWMAVPGATGYRVWGQSSNAATSAFFIGATTTATQLTAPVAQGTLSWYVEARFGDCPSTFSRGFSLVVSTGASCNNSATMLIAPANNATNVLSPVTFQWNPVPGSIGYKLYVQDPGQTAADLVGFTTDTSISRIVPDGAVTWFVDTMFAGCNDVRSAQFKFTSGTPSCPSGSITLKTPAEQTTVTSPVTMTWTPIGGATSYRIWVAIDGGSPTVIAHSNNASQSVSLPSGSIEWSVEALFDNNCPSIFSLRGHFNISKGANCDSHKNVTLVSPINGAQVSSSIDFTWSATDSAAILYRVWVSVDGEPFGDIGFTKDIHLKHDFTTTGSGQWYVESFFEGCSPLFSGKGTFVIPAAAHCNNDSAQIVSPPDNSNNVTSPVTLVWSAVTNATEYRIFASLNGGDFSLIGKTKETSLSAAAPPGAITWKVESVFDSCPSTYSSKGHFTVVRASNCGADESTLIAPADGAAQVTSPVHFQWSPVSNAVGYALYIRTEDGASTLLAETTTATDVTKHIPEGKSEWMVVAFFSGCPPLESDHSTFTIPPSTCDHRRPILASPDEGASGLSSPIHFEWTRIPDATSYKVWASIDDDGPSVIGTTTDKRLTANMPAGTFHWYVEAFFASCPSVTSAMSSFNVRKSPPPCTTPAKPRATVPGQVASNTVYNVRWNAVINATNYDLQESPTADFAAPTTQVINGLMASFIHTAASQPVKWFYRVRALSSCSDEHGPYSAVVTIAILPDMPLRHTTVEVGTESTIKQTVFIPGQTPPVQFTARTDKPWATVTPSSGTLGPAGVTLTIVSDQAALKLGTNTATVILTYSSSGKTAISLGSAPANVPVSVGLVTPVAPGGKNAPLPNSLIIPAVGHAQGLNNSLFESDVRIANISAQTMKYLLNFTLSGTDSTQSGLSTTIQVDPGATMALDDILTSFFGTGTDGSSALGVLEIRPLTTPPSGLGSSSSTSVNIQTVASSRTYNSTPTGTFGQFIPAIPYAQFISKPSDPSIKTVISLQQIAQSAAYRTNFGVVEASGEAASVLVHVFDTAGNELAQIPMSLLPGQHTQLNLLAANGITLNDGRFEVEVTSTTGKVTAYASVIDNLTNDPLLVFPVLKGGESSTRYVIPGVADINNGLANWRSDIRLFNAGSSQVNATLTYFPQPGNTSASGPVQISIKPGEEKAIDNAMQSLYGLSNTGGSLLVSSPTSAPLIVTARTYNQTSSGTYGQFIPAVTPAASVGLSDNRILQLLQLESSDRMRTNIGFVETSGNPVTIEVSAIPVDSKIAVKTQFPLGANQFLQVPLSVFNLGTAYNVRVTVKVLSGTGRVTAYGSVIDAITQDPTYVPAQ